MRMILYVVGFCESQHLTLTDVVRTFRNPLRQSVRSIHCGSVVPNRPGHVGFFSLDD